MLALALLYLERELGQTDPLRIWNYLHQKQETKHAAEGLLGVGTGRFPRLQRSGLLSLNSTSPASGLAVHRVAACKSMGLYWD